jgi:hypothetical protein
MKKRTVPSKKIAKKSAKVGRFVIGHVRFSKISAVEGIVLTPDMKARKTQLERSGASPAERRAAIIKAHKH